MYCLFILYQQMHLFIYIYTYSTKLHYKCSYKFRYFCTIFREFW